MIICADIQQQYCNHTIAIHSNKVTLRYFGVKRNDNWYLNISTVVMVTCSLPPELILNSG